jgi:hypothetical protein
VAGSRACPRGLRQSRSKRQYGGTSCRVGGDEHGPLSQPVGKLTGERRGKARQVTEKSWVLP